MGTVPPLFRGGPPHLQHRRLPSHQGCLPVLAYAKHRVFGALPLSGAHGVPTTSRASMPIYYPGAHSARSGMGFWQAAECIHPGCFLRRAPRPSFILPALRSQRVCSCVALSAPSVFNCLCKKGLAVFASKALMKKDLAQRALHRTRSVHQQPSRLPRSVMYWIALSSTV